MATVAWNPKARMDEEPILPDETGLTYRLLAASACTYAIDKAGGVEKCPQFPFVGFKDDPATFQAGPDDINACLVGDMEDGVVLAFRGTIPFDIHNIKSLIDWINDFDAVPVNIDGLPGRVHDGFHKSVASLWDKFLPAIQERMSESKPLYVTGHSKGAGMAPIAAALLRNRLGINASVIQLFAPPRPGTEDFSNYFDESFPGTVRYEHQDDLGPHLPVHFGLMNALSKVPKIGPFFRGLKAWDYSAVGQLRFIDWNGKIVGELSGLENKRFERLALLIAELRFRKIGEDHALLGGYSAAVRRREGCSVA